MASAALAYQLGHGTLGVPLSFPTKGGQRCGHYVTVTTSGGRTGFRFLRDPNTVCGLPSKNPNVSACVANPQACSMTTLPPGWNQIGSAAIGGRTPSETLGNVIIR